MPASLRSKIIHIAPERAIHIVGMRTPAPDFVHRALAMLQSTGWIAEHRFLFAGVRCHLLGWPRGLAPDGRRAAFSSAAAPVRASPHTICMEPV